MVLHALVLATSMSQVDLLTELIIPTIYSIEWCAFTRAALIDKVSSAISRWSDWPVLAEHCVRVSRHIGAGSFGSGLPSGCESDANAFADFLARQSDPSLSE